MAKEKKVSISLITNDGDGADLHARKDRLVAAHHPHLAEARVALMWRYDQKPDADNHLTLGKARKLSDLDREIQDLYDAVIELNYEAWQTLLEKQRDALLDHELCHLAIMPDDNGDPKRDERGRLVLRIRKHSIEEFTEIVHRYGCYKADLEAFVRTALAAKDTPLFAPERTLEERARDIQGDEGRDSEGFRIVG